MTRALVPLAEGVEEMEAVILIDVLRRAGWEVTTAGLMPGPVRASRGVVLVPDALWDEVDADRYDWLVLPGGAQGTQNLRRDQRVLRAVRRFVESGRRVAAVCAAPLVLQDAGVLTGRRATAHPAVIAELTQAVPVTDAVVVDGPVVTSRAAGTCFALALELVRLVDGPDKVAALREALVL